MYAQHSRARIAQWSERSLDMGEVVGSIPTARTEKTKGD